MPDKTIRIALACALLLPWLFVFSLFRSDIALATLAIAGIGLAYIVSRFRLFALLFQAIALSLPFSVEAFLSEGNKAFVPSEALILLAALAFIWDFILSPRDLHIRSLLRDNLILLPLVLSIVLSLIVSSMPAVSLKSGVVSLSYLFVFLIILRRKQEDGYVSIRQLIDVYAFGFLIVMAYGFWMYAGLGFNPKAIKGVFEPFYTDHTIVGAASAMLAGWYFGRAITGNHTRSVFINAVVALVFVLMVLFSSSRAALWSLPLALVLALLLRLRLKTWFFALMAGVFLIFVWINRFNIADELAHIRYDSGNTQMSMIEQAKSVGNVSTDVSNLERLNRWQAGIKMWKDRPLAGFGPGTFQFQYIPYQDERFMNRLSVTDPWHIPENSGGSAHSEYVLALSENGIIGIVAMLILWIGILVKGLRSAWGPAMPALLALSTYYFHAFFNNFLTTDKLAFLFYGMAAFILMSSTKHEYERK
jgi:putative inorganic carbon (hco3(-)) transporter